MNLENKKKHHVHACLWRDYSRHSLSSFILYRYLFPSSVSISCKHSKQHFHFPLHKCYLLIKKQGIFFFFGPRSKIWPLTQRHMGQSVPRACQAIALGCAPTCTISMRSVQPLCGTRRMFRTSVHTSGGVQASVR